MSTTVGFGLILPEEYTPLATHEAAIGSVEARLTRVEESVSGSDGRRVQELEAKVASLEQALQSIRQSAVSAADLDHATQRIAAAEGGVQALQTQVADFSFRTGSVAELRDIGTLPEDQLFILVDTEENLSRLAAEQSGGDRYFNIVLGAAAAS